MEDRELIHRCLRGEISAFEHLVNRYRQLVAGVVMSMISNRERAEEIGQDVFVKFYNSLANFRGEASVSTFLQHIAMNECRTELRRYKTLKGRMRRQQEELPLYLPDKSTAHKRMEDKELIGLLLSSLPEKLKEVVVIHLIQGNNTRETAEILGIAEGTVLSRMSRAREKMKDKWKHL